MCASFAYGEPTHICRCCRLVLYKWSGNDVVMPFIKFQTTASTFDDLRAQLHQRGGTPCDARLFIIDDSDGMLWPTDGSPYNGKLPADQQTPLKVYVCPAISQAPATTTQHHVPPKKGELTGLDTENHNITCAKTECKGAHRVCTDSRWQNFKDNYLEYYEALGK